MQLSSTAIEQSASASADRVALTGTQVAEVIDQITVESSDKITLATSQSVAIISESGNEITQSIVTKSTEVGGIINSQAKHIGETLGERLIEISGVLEIRGNELNSVFDNQIERFEEQVMKRTTETTNMLIEKGQEVAIDLSKKSSEFNEMLENRTKELAAIFNDGTSTITIAFDSRSQDFNNLVSERAEKLNNALKIHSETFANLVDDKTNLFLTALHNRGNDVTTELENTQKAVIAGINSATDSANAAIQESSNLLVSLFENKAENSVEIISDATTKGYTQLNDIISKLGVTSDALNEVISIAGENLGTIDDQLASRVISLQDSYKMLEQYTHNTKDTVETQVTVLSEISNTILRDVVMVAEQFSNQGMAIAEASSSLSENSLRLEDVLIKGSQSLQGFTDDVESRAVNVGAMLQRYSQALETSLNEAETRALEASVSLNESAQNHAKSISTNLQDIRQIVSDESRRTSDELKTSYDELARTVDSLIHETSGQFKNAAQDLRGVASDVSRELRDVSAELSSGLNMLPGETRAQTDAMRQVINDQIEALDELGKVINRHSDSVVQRPSSSSRSSYSSGSRNDDPRGYSFRNEMEPDRQSQVEYQSRSNNNPGFFLGKNQEKTPNIANNQRSARKSASLNESDGSNWSLSDLLNRASDGTNNSKIGLLDDIIPDIISSIDQAKIRDTWSRYYSGERNVFTKRLYNLQGQRVFDNIQSKYSRDGQFRSTVDDFVEQFEQKLDYIGRNDSDGSQMEGMLLTDSGRAYTMLAHASGRFH